MDVGVSNSHVFINYSPRAFFSQWDTSLHGTVVSSLLLLGLTFGLPLVLLCFCFQDVVYNEDIDASDD